MRHAGPNIGSYPALGALAFGTGSRGASSRGSREFSRTFSAASDPFKQAIRQSVRSTSGPSGQERLQVESGVGDGGAVRRAAHVEQFLSGHIGLCVVDRVHRNEVALGKVPDR